MGQYSVGLVLDEGSAGNANGYGGDGSVAEGDDVLPSLQSFVMRPTRHHFWLVGAVEWRARAGCVTQLASIMPRCLFLHT